MRIIIWPFFAILMEQTLCLSNFGFGSSSEEVVPEQFLEDLRKLVPDRRLSKNGDDISEMLTELLKLDLGQNPESHSFKMDEKSTISSLSDPTQRHLLELSKLSNVDQNLSNHFPPLLNQSEASAMDIKSLFEWVELDRMLEKNPSKVNVTQETPQSEVKDDQVVKSKSKENNIDEGSDHLEKLESINPVNEKQLIENNPELHPISSLTSKSETDGWLKNTFLLKKASQEEQINAPGFYASSTDWRIPQTVPDDLSKIHSGFHTNSVNWITSQPNPTEDLSMAEEDKHPDKKASFTNSILSKLNVNYWKDLNWSQFFPNPFA